MHHGRPLTRDRTAHPTDGARVLQDAGRVQHAPVGHGQRRALDRERVRAIELRIATRVASDDRDSTRQPAIQLPEPSAAPPNLWREDFGEKQHAGRQDCRLTPNGAKRTGGATERTSRVTAAGAG